MKKKALMIFFIIGAITMIAMSAHYLHSSHSGILRSKEVARHFWYIIVFRGHVMFGLLAISLGPFQFTTSSKKGKKSKSLHKTLGYLYMGSIVISSVSGLLIAPFSMGGWITAVGFSVLSVLWLIITIKSVIEIKKRNFSNHRRWAYYSYALTFAAITQRTLLLIPLLSNVPFMPVYQVSAWLPWLLNLTMAHLILKRPSKLYQKHQYTLNS